MNRQIKYKFVLGALLTVITTAGCSFSKKTVQDTNETIVETTFAETTIVNTTDESTVDSSTETTEESVSSVSESVENTTQEETAVIIEETIEQELSELDIVLQSQKSAYVGGINCIAQMPSLPSGCEVASLTMALRKAGYNADVFDISDNYLDKGEKKASNPSKVFVGDPRDPWSYGCYAPVIVNCALKYGASVSNVTGIEFSELCAYTEADRPVVIWATLDMAAPDTEIFTWYDEEGNEIIWSNEEHCLLFVGYDADENEAYIADPMYGYVVTYNLSTFYTRWVQMGRQAVVVN